jgi:hypothetical protein
MADDSDALFGLILFILFLALLGYAAGGMSSSPSTSGTTGGTSQSYPALTGSKVDQCMGTPGPSRSNATNPPNITLTTYMDGGATCATAQYKPDPTLPASDRKALLTVTLAYAGKRTIAQPASTEIVLSPADKTTPQTVSVEVTGTGDLCIAASAKLEPLPPDTFQPPTVNISPVQTPCDMTPAGMPPAGPGPDLPGPAVDIEEEEGY